jgi:C4-dicarboxylate-specific signal transduction histidine kinase
MGEGTGLGLSVSYGIIHDMQGTIFADNIDGGARFSITLPIVR